MDSGYILDIYTATPYIRLVGRLENGETFECNCLYSPNRLYVRNSDINQINKIKEISPTNLMTMDGESVSRAELEPGEIPKIIQDSNVSTYEADLNAGAKFQIDTGIRRQIRIRGKCSKGHFLDRVYQDPTILENDDAMDFPKLRALSIDIETSVGGEVTAISCCGFWVGKGEESESVLAIGNKKSDATVTYYSDETALLRGFLSKIKSENPDLLIGWNIIEFDLRVLRDRFEACRVAFRLGRSRKRSWIQENGRWGQRAVVVHGRQVVDIMQVMRRHLNRLPDYRLDTVVRKVLGRGKLVAVDYEGLMKLSHEDQDLFLKYCLEDARLVREIVEKEKVLDLAVRKSILTGLPISRADGNIAAFDLLYGLGLRKRGMVSPTLGVDRATRGRAPGGIVLSSRPGIYENVWLFDFKSLYPSIMMTLNIDPLSHVLAQTSSIPYLETPNGTKFARSKGILPEILEDLWESRELAKRSEDITGSHSYKILMNSFYGVLASGSCRFANPKIVGAITRFGHEILRWTKDIFESIDKKNPYEVLYGDTDSLFVKSQQKGIKDTIVTEMGQSLCIWVNKKLEEYLWETYRVPSKMELEFAKAYRKFYLPYHRGADRGRAKGYAGTVIGSGESLEIVGMEAVRRDWTDLAHNIQRNVLKLVFLETPAKEVEDFVWFEVCAVRDGERDEELVYRRRLRRDIAAYTKSTPPHVKAAKLVGAEKGELIKYVMTTLGPEPLDALSSPVDYNHYIEKQISPIIHSIARVFPLDVRSALFGERQLF